MPSLHHGAIFVGAFLIVTGGSTAFVPSSQSRLQAFSLCCVVLGVIMLILGLFWAMNSKNTSSYNQQEFDPDCPHYPYDYPGLSSHALFTQQGGRYPESQSVFLPRWVQEEWFGFEMLFDLHVRNFIVWIRTNDLILLSFQLYQIKAG